MSSADYDVQADIVGIADILRSDPARQLRWRAQPAGYPPRPPSVYESGTPSASTCTPERLLLGTARPAGAPASSVLWSHHRCGADWKSHHRAARCWNRTVTLKAYVDGCSNGPLPTTTYQHTAPRQPGIYMRYGGTAADFSTSTMSRSERCSRRPCPHRRHAVRVADHRCPVQRGG